MLFIYIVVSNNTQHYSITVALTLSDIIKIFITNDYGVLC